MSRSVRMPRPGASGSMTTAAPTRRFAMACAAWRNVWFGPTVSTIVLMPSRTRIRPSPRPTACNDCRNVTGSPAGAGGREAVPSSGNVPNRTVRLSHPVGAFERIPGVPIQRPATVRLRTSLFDDAVAIVEQEYATDVSLDDIARRVASSRRQLQRAYAEIGDTTFREHLTRVRMQRAAELLSRRGMTVREVARRVGYRQPAQFAKAFRRYQGLAPVGVPVRRARARTASLQRAA